ncbi:chemotaxis protein CheW [Saccharophagus sp. K07]|uniref:chemotaxis protein CheW n=1 Tax=Saccharophagus sp. K07 TaxID=2283636 RepID=UPI001652633C|nr:chemotaxis protein CheW [Saccharophagus sp. K07]MBC6907142.1 chemotaxis protein CheW [Saccharophagus sp. K07]
MFSDDQRAVQAYLDDLLAELPSFEPEAKTADLPLAAIRAVPSPNTAPVAKVATKVQVQPRDSHQEALEQVRRQQLQALLDRSPVPQAVTAAPITATPVPLAETVTPVAEAVVEPQVLAATAVQVREDNSWAENGRPLWAQKHFEVLLCRVSGLTLAVPLVALGHIHPLTEQLTPIFGQAEWFMGLQPTPAGQIRVVNTALFVMPERYDPAFVESARYVITIDGLDWGLAIDQVQQPTRLNPEDVTWRGERSKRPWLAGTIKSAMCALLDIPRMGQMLESQDRNRAKASDPLG